VNDSDKNFRQKSKHRFLCSINFFFPKIVLCVEKHGTTRQSTHDNTRLFRKNAICRVIKAITQTKIHNIQYLSSYNWLNPSDPVKCVKVPQKLRHCTTTYLLLRPVFPNCKSKEGDERVYIRLFQCSFCTSGVGTVKISWNIILLKYW
jgi:hypothetical protein